MAGKPTKAELERRKLTLEIDDLKRPMFVRPTFWISVASAIVALGGVVGQNILSDIKVESAKLDAASKTAAADKRTHAAELTEKVAQAAVEEFKRREEELQDRVNELSGHEKQVRSDIKHALTRLRAILVQVDKLKDAGVDATLIAEVRAELQDTQKDLRGGCSRDLRRSSDKALILNAAQIAESQKTHLPWGIPKLTTLKDANIEHLGHPWWFSGYSKAWKVPLWAAYRVGSENVMQRQRKDCFRQDPRLPTTLAVAHRTYGKNRFDRGHIVPRSIMRQSDEASAAVYLYSNIAPQHPRHNRQSWRRVEDFVRDLLKQHDELYIITGTAFDHDRDGEPDSDLSEYVLEPDRTTVPSHFYKIIAVVENGRPSKIYAILQAHEKTPVSRWTYNLTVTTIDHLEKLTGFDFFPDLQGNEWEVVEAKFWSVE